MRINWKYLVILIFIIGVLVLYFGVLGYRYFISKGETESDSQDKKLQQLYEEKLKVQSSEVKQEFDIRVIRKILVI